MSKFYLVTGGSGFIGAALVKRLVDRGYRVRVMDDNSRGAPRRLDGYLDRIEMAVGDVRDPAAVSVAAKGVDGICHLAYLNGTRFFYERPDDVLEIGVKGMVNVLDACAEHGIDELVLASSSEVYQTPPQTPTDESAPLIVPDVMNPRFSYGGGKIISELMAINYGRRRLKRVVIFRPHNVYGPDMGWEHVAPQFALKLAARLGQADPIPFPIQGSGRETRAFIFIDDFIDGLMAVIEKGEHLNVYHIGTTEEVSVARFAEMVAEAAGRTITVEPGELTMGSTARRCPDIGKLAALGFAPKTSMAAGLAKTVRWYIDNADMAPPEA